MASRSGGRHYDGPQSEANAFVAMWQLRADYFTRGILRRQPRKVNGRRHLANDCKGPLLRCRVLEGLQAFESPETYELWTVPCAILILPK